MPILTRSEAELLEKSRSDMRRLLPSLTNTAEGSTAGALLEIAASANSDIHRQIDILQRNLFVSTATGDALDGIGELLGVSRGAALRAFDDSRNVRVRIDPAVGEGAGIFVRTRIPSHVIDQNPDTLTSSGFTIREGTTLSTNSGTTYTTVHPVTLSGDDTEAFVGVIATGTGNSFNVSTGELRNHDLKTFQPELALISDFVLVENRMPITTGRFTETDDDYRLRIVNAIFTTQAANSTAIINSALSVPGVRNAIYLPFSSGLHSFSVVIETTDPIVSTGLVNAAQQAVNSVVAAGNRGMVTRPIYKGLEAKVGLRYRARADRPHIRQNARRAAVDYINGIGLGEEFILNELIQRIMDVSEDLLDTQFQRFATGTYNPETHMFDQLQEQIPSNMTLQNVLESWYTSDRLFTVCDQ
jgi:uncharacterized phage protein gp47/JayE